MMDEKLYINKEKPERGLTQLGICVLVKEKQEKGGKYHKITSKGVTILIHFGKQNILTTTQKCF